MERLIQLNEDSALLFAVEARAAGRTGRSHEVSLAWMTESLLEGPVYFLHPNEGLKELC